MKKLFVVVLAILAVTLWHIQPVDAININVSRRDLKLATQQLMEKLSLSAPNVNDSNAVLLDNQGDDDGTGATVSSFLAQPDFSRNVSVIPVGSTGDVAAGIVVVTGTDEHGSTISESFTFLANATTAVEGSKAFKTITSIAFPAEDAPYDALWAVGYGEKLGLHRCMAQAGHIIQATLGGAKEGTDPTMTADASTISNNTADLSSLLDGTSDVEVYYIQNFRCSP